MHSVDVARRIYKAVFQRYLSLRGFLTTDFFGDVRSFMGFAQSRRTVGRTFEIMIHPVCVEGGEIVDSVEGYNAEKVLRNLRDCQYEITALDA